MLHYTDHVRDRMKERNISQEEVETCVENPETTYPSDDDLDCKNYVHTFSNGRRIRVVVNEAKPGHKVVVTAMVQGD